MNILSTGSIYLDITTHLEGVHTSLIPEKEYILPAYETALGGSAVIAPVAMAKLGLTPHFVGVAGRDDFGQLVSQMLEKSGIKSHLELNSDVQTNIGINRIDGSGKTYMDALGNANSHLSPRTLQEVVDQEFGNLDLLYLGSVFKTPKLLETLIATAKSFSEAGKLIFLDHGRAPSSLSREEILATLNRLMPFVTHYAPSEQDIESVWNLNSATELVASLLEKYPSLVTHIKMGEQGSIVGYMGKSTQIAPHGVIDLKIKPNFVGAGDTSNAGFIYGLSKKLDPIHSSKIANHAAYLHITRQKLLAQLLL